MVNIDLSYCFYSELVGRSSNFLVVLAIESEASDISDVSESPSTC